MGSISVPSIEPAFRRVPSLSLCGAVAVSGSTSGVGRASANTMNAKVVVVVVAAAVVAAVVVLPCIIMIVSGVSHGRTRPSSAQISRGN